MGAPHRFVPASEGVLKRNAREIKLQAPLPRKRQTARGPLLPLNGYFACGGRRGKAGSGQASALRWSGRRCAPTALRCSVSWPVAKLTALTSFAAFKQAATSQMTTRAAREATSPALLGAPEVRSSLPARTFADTVFVLVETAPSVPERQAAPGGGDVCGDEERKIGRAHV